MGVVYKAEDTTLDRFVALKFLPHHLSQTEEEKQRFIHEAKAASALDHTNICTVYEIGETDDGQMFIAMAYYEGESLKEKIERGPMVIEEAVAIATQISRGLAKAHSKEITHRDIKPANLLITEDDTVKIVDFGLAKLAGRTMLTKEGTTLGTASYMSPEQTQGAAVDHRTDIWALGVVLYEMITGKQPFLGDYEQAVLYSIMNEDPEPITGLRTGVPMELELIVNKCLAKDPEDRYPASDGLIVDLRQLKKETSKVTTAASKTEAYRTVHEKETSTTLTVTPKFKKLLIGLVSLVLIALGVFALWNFLLTEAPELIENRVAVAYFKNETGDSSLDYLRKRTADHLTQGIGRVDFVEVAALVPENEIDFTKPSTEQLKLLSDKTGANIIVSGVFYKEGNTLVFQPQVNNITTGKPLRALPRITGTVSDPIVMLDDISQRILSLLGFKFDIPWKTYGDYMGYIPTYDAFKEYKEGWGLYYNLDFMESIERYQKAVALDSTFIHAYLMIGIVFYDGGFNAEADSMVQFLNEIRDDFTLNERKLVTWFKAMLHNDLTGYLQVCREIAEFDADWQWNTGWGAFNVNRLYEAENWFAQVDPDKSGLAATWESFWGTYGATLHMLGKHEAELQVVNDRRQRFPESRNAFVMEIIAHIALGNLQEAKDLKKDIYVPMERINPGHGLIVLAKEFAAHGYEKEARDFIEEAIQWFRERPESERTAHRVNLFDALNISVFTLGTKESLQQAVEQEQQKIQLTSNRDERIQMMRQIVQELVEEEPSNEDYQGRLGILYAQLADRENAARIFGMLGDLDEPYLHGTNIFWQAAIAAQLGEHSRAVTLLYDAQSKGNAFGSGFHRDPVWMPLKDHPGFREFIRPKK